MWLRKDKFWATLKSSGFSLAWLTARLGCTQTVLNKIANGQAAANYRIAKELLLVFGYDKIVQAIDWGRTSYAGR